MRYECELSTRPGLKACVPCAQGVYSVHKATSSHRTTSPRSPCSRHPRFQAAALLPAKSGPGGVAFQVARFRGRVITLTLDLGATESFYDGTEDGSDMVAQAGRVLG